MPNHETTPAELTRREVIALESRVKILEKAVATEQEMKYNAYKRIAELNEKLNNVRDNVR